MPERPGLYGAESSTEKEKDNMNAYAIDAAAVPREVRDDLARPLLERVAAYFEQPGTEEAFQAWLVEYKKRKPAASVAGA